MELRKRHIAEAPPFSPVSAFTEKVKKLDAYPKTLDDFKERTSSGAAVSIVCMTLILALVISELRAYLTPITLDQLHVDTARSARIHINFNMTFPNMPCSGLALVAMDIAGEQQIDVVSNINKTRYSLDGKYLAIEEDDAKIAKRMQGQCGSCFAHLKHFPAIRSGLPNYHRPVIEDEVPDTCCNSCGDVRSVYQTRKSLKWEEHPLCLHEVRHRLGRTRYGARTRRPPAWRSFRHRRH